MDQVGITPDYAASINQQAAQMQGSYCAPVERDNAFIARMMANLGQEQTTLRKADYLRLCQMAAKGL